MQAQARMKGHSFGLDEKRSCWPLVLGAAWWSSHLISRDGLFLQRNRQKKPSRKEFVYQTLLLAHFMFDPAQAYRNLNLREIKPIRVNKRCRHRDGQIRTGVRGDHARGLFRQTKLTCGVAPSSPWDPNGEVSPVVSTFFL